MASAEQVGWLVSAARAARAAGHIWPAMAACEAALESGWGESELAREDHNLFGCKQHLHPVYGTVHIPTREFVSNAWVTVDAAWVRYPDDAACFEDRMRTLRMLSTTYPNYAMALVADTAEEYVAEVSQTWSTDPERAEKCIAIYRAHQAELESAVGTPTQGLEA